MGKVRKYLLDGNKPSTVIANTLTGVAASIPGWIPNIRLNQAKGKQWTKGPHGHPSYISDTNIVGDNHLSPNGTFDYPGRTGPYAEINRMGPNDVATMHKIRALFVGSLFAGLLGLNAAYNVVSYFVKRKAIKDVKGTKWEKPISAYLKKTYIPFAGKAIAEKKLYSDLIELVGGVEALGLPEGVLEPYEQRGNITKPIKERVRELISEDATAPSVLCDLIGVSRPKQSKETLDSKLAIA